MRSSGIGSAFVIFVALGAAGAHAQDLRLTGHVLSDSAKPLVQAQVFLEGMGIGGLTDSDGKYAFILSAARLHGQTAKLTARLIGYRPTSVDVVLSGTTNEHDFALAIQPLYCHCDPVIIPTQPTTITTAAFLDEHADVARAAGLRELRTTRRSGDREIRIWKWGGRFFELYRLVERSGGVKAERIRYVKKPDDPRIGSRLPFEMRYDVHGCTPVKRGMVTACREDLHERSEWKLSWDELERDGIWDLPGEETQNLPIFVEDGSGDLVTVELWDGQAYRAWSYLTADEETAGRSGNGRDRANAIWRATSVIDSHAQR
jgi:hypothetical protein